MMHYSREMITDYYYQELEKKEYLDVHNHLTSCSKCNTVLYEIKSLTSGLDSLNTIPTPNVTFNFLKIETPIKEETQAFPYMFLVIAVIIFLPIYIFQSTIATFFDSLYLSQILNVNELDALSKSIILFILSGTFLSLSIAPILKNECMAKYNFNEVV